MESSKTQHADYLLEIGALSPEQYCEFIGVATYRDPRWSRSARESSPTERIKVFLEKWPELRELYNYNPIIRVGLDGIAYAKNEKTLIETAVHILMQFDKTNAMLMKAIEQGFRPQD